MGNGYWKGEEGQHTDEKRGSEGVLGLVETWINIVASSTASLDANHVCNGQNAKAIYNRSGHTHNAQSEPQERLGGPIPTGQRGQPILSASLSRQRERWAHERSCTLACAPIHTLLHFGSGKNMADAAAPAPGGQDTSPFGIKSKLNDRVAGRNWTWPLRIACIITGIGTWICDIALTVVEFSCCSSL